MVARCVVRVVDISSLQHRLGSRENVFRKTSNQERTWAEESVGALQRSVAEEEGGAVATRLLRSVSDSRSAASLRRPGYVALVEALGGRIWAQHAEGQSKIQGSQTRDGREMRNHVVEYGEDPILHLARVWL